MNTLMQTPRIALWVGLAAAVVFVTGCTEVGPDYVRPSASVPAAYKEATAHGTGAPAIAGAWWQVYHDATLDGLVSQAVVSNQSLAAAAARTREAQQLLLVAEGPLKPTLSVGTIKSGRKNQNDVGLGASWEIDLWGRIRRDVEAHRASAEASSDDLAAATLSLQAQVVQGYFALREADALIALLEQASAVQDQSNRIVRNQYDQGLASSAGLAEALTHATTVQLQLADTRTARAQYEHALAVLLGKAPADFSVAPAPFDTAVPAVPDSLPAKLLERRPDVAASERRMAAASARIGVAKAEALPSISVLAGIGILKGPTVTADVRAPLFTGGRLDAQIAGANAGYDEAVANYRQTVLNALREVEDNLVASTNLAGNAGLQGKAADVARESSRVTGNQYNAGVVDYSAMVDASSATLNAGQVELQVRLRRLVTSVNLMTALGGGWQVPASKTP